MTTILQDVEERRDLGGHLVVRQNGGNFGLKVLVKYGFYDRVSLYLHREEKYLGEEISLIVEVQWIGCSVQTA
ncbi:MAG: hypothetical protein Q7J12_06595 [Syntrophales bacterium]|nr:hypothetical protein [Syntrophales bacterium]